MCQWGQWDVCGCEGGAFLCVVVPSSSLAPPPPPPPPNPPQEETGRRLLCSFLFSLYTRNHTPTTTHHNISTPSKHKTPARSPPHHHHQSTTTPPPKHHIHQLDGVLDFISGIEKLSGGLGLGAASGAAAAASQEEEQRRQRQQRGEEMREGIEAGKRGVRMALEFLNGAGMGGMATGEFSPSPEETWALVEDAYPVARNLVRWVLALVDGVGGLLADSPRVLGVRGCMHGVLWERFTRGSLCVHCTSSSPPPPPSPPPPL